MLNYIETESENSNFLIKYGRIGKHPMQSLIQGTTVPCDYVHLRALIVYLLNAESC